MATRTSDPTTNRFVEMPSITAPTYGTRRPSTNDVSNGLSPALPSG
jgi:hypothetical protein